jgi:hypothetical protein
MKFRSGFVSNSSSSSFMIAFKEKPSQEQWDQVFKIDKTSPIYGIMKDIVSTIESCSRHTFVPSPDYPASPSKDYSDYLRKDGYESDSEGDMEIWDALKNGFTVMVGDFADDNGPVEALLYETDLFHKDDNLIISHHGGY